ncbi:MAG: polysaccharide biosynthesis tyrosine autokinase, partial [Actinobacteria bacterium]|nr:polysaccharide biosynthesis tyrosine autokinase [Actinomycetota bacterium]
EDRLEDDDQDGFRPFAQLLSAIFHHEYHSRLEALKDAYAPFHPDPDTRVVRTYDDGDRREARETLTDGLRELLDEANFEEVSFEELEAAFEEDSLVELELEIDRSEFDEVLFFRRGETQREETVSEWFGLRERTVTFTNYEKVLIYVSFKDPEHLPEELPDELPYEPGATTLKLFQDVPRADLEMLFPNAEPRMRRIDKILIGVPAVFSGIIIASTKLLTTLGLIILLFGFWLGIRDEAVELDQTTLVTLGAGLGSLFGYITRQFTKYRSRQMQFMRALTENLYFRNLDNDEGVFHHLLDAAEEEEVKEAMLAWYFLRAADEPLTGEDLDEAVEEWSASGGITRWTSRSATASTSCACCSWSRTPTATGCGRCPWARRCVGSTPGGTRTSRTPTVTSPPAGRRPATVPTGRLPPVRLRHGGPSLAPYEQQDTLDLRDYLAVLRRRRRLIVATVVIVVAAAIGVTMLQTPLYQSTVELVVEPFDGPTDRSALERALFGNTELQTQRKLVKSVPVAERVIEDLGLDRAPKELLEVIDVDVVTDTQVLEITATDEDPELAAALAGSVADSYLADRRDQALERVLTAGQSLEDRAQSIRDRIDELSEQIQAAEASGTAEEEGAPTAAPTDEGELATLRQERDSLLTQLGQVTAQLSTLESRDALVRGGGEVIRPAEVPTSPASPKPIRTGILALVLGLMLGVGLAFLRDFLDDAIHGDDDAVRAAEAPVLGHIPFREESDRDKRLATLVDEFSPKAEAFRTLRSNVRFVLYGGRGTSRGDATVGRSLAVTSAVAAEGKTTTAANLAVAAARAGTKVLLIDADLRRPGVAKVLGLDNAPGLSDLLVGEVELQDIVVDIGVPNLRVITSGNVPPNPAELLAGTAMRDLHLRLEALSELIVYDTAPILAVADTLEVAPISSQTVIVVDTRNGSRRNLRHTADKLRGVGAEVAGVVLNNVTPGDRYYYAYDQYDYPPEEQPASAGPPPGTWTASRSDDQFGKSRATRGVPRPETDLDTQADPTRADEPAASAPASAPPEPTIPPAEERAAPSGGLPIDRSDEEAHRAERVPDEPPVRDEPTLDEPGPDEPPAREEPTLDEPVPDESPAWRPREPRFGPSEDGPASSSNGPTTTEPPSRSEQPAREQDEPSDEDDREEPLWTGRGTGSHLRDG